MDQEQKLKENQFLELFDLCEDVEKKEKALKVLWDWLYTEERLRIEEKIKKFKEKNKVFITKKFQLSDAHRDLLPFMRSAKLRAIQKIRELGIIKDEDNAFRCP